jgi:general secretion pathway protein J
MNSKKSRRPLSFLARQGSGGFTLIELLVAITILAIVAVMGWRGLDSIIRVRTALDGEMRQMGDIQLVFAQMQNDCMQVVSAGELPGRAYLVTGDGSLTLLRAVSSDSQPTQFEIVSYRYKDGILVRKETLPTRDLATLDSLWQTAVADGSVENGIKLHANLEGINLRSYRNGAWLGPSPAEFDPSQPPATALEVELRLKGHEGSIVKSFLVGES